MIDESKVIGVQIGKTNTVGRFAFGSRPKNGLVQKRVTTVIGNRLKAALAKTAFTGIIKIVSHYLSMKCAVAVKCAETQNRSQTW